MWEKIKLAPLAVTFEDVVIIPGYSSVEPYEIDLSTNFSRNISVSIPLVSSPMDMVTNDRVAGIIALMGGIGTIHRHCSVEEQEKLVKNVKKMDVSRDMPTFRLDMNIKDVPKNLKKLIGNVAVIVDDVNILGVIKLSNIVLDVENKKTGTLGEILEEMAEEKNISKAIKIENSVVIIERYPRNSIRPTLDEEGRLRVAGACSPFDRRRLKMLEACADAIVMDVAHFHTKTCIEATRAIQKEICKDLIIGNIGTSSAVEDIITKIEKIDGFRVGIGSGSICKTGEDTGVFAPTLFATIEAKSTLDKYGLKIPIIADGGISSIANALKALVFGASAVMCGRYLAGCLESPGPIIEIDGKKYKPYRGMGSLSVKFERMIDRYSKITKTIAEGVEGLVPLQGSIIDVIHKFIEGLKIAMGYAGAKKVSDLVKAKVAIISPRGRREISPHNIMKIDPKDFWKMLREIK